MDAALDFFYHSAVYQLIHDGVSDMHCMSDAYLSEELEQEYSGNYLRFLEKSAKILLYVYKVRGLYLLCLKTTEGGLDYAKRKCDNHCRLSSAGA